MLAMAIWVEASGVDGKKKTHAGSPNRQYVHERRCRAARLTGSEPTPVWQVETSIVQGSVELTGDVAIAGVRCDTV